MLDDEPNSLAALNLDFLADQLSATLDAAAAGLPVLPGSATRLLAAQVVTYTELVTVWSANPHPRPNPDPNPNTSPNPDPDPDPNPNPNPNPHQVWRAVAPPPPAPPSLAPPPRDAPALPPSSRASLMDDVTIIILVVLGACILCVICVAGGTYCHRKR